MSLLPALFERRLPLGFEDLFDAMTENKPGWGQIRVDVKETPVEYVIMADIPGAKKNEIDVSLVNQVLMISTEREEEEEEKDEGYIVRERRFRSLQRSIPLGAAGSPENVKAEYKDGVLEVHVKKAPEKQAKRIPIQ